MPTAAAAGNAPAASDYNEALRTPLDKAMNRLSGTFAGLILILSAIGTTPSASAKAYHPTAEEAIQRAEFIALVDIDKVEQQTVKGSPFDYHQQSSAKVKENYKGTLPSTVTISGAESFECAQCSFPVGEAIVLLKKSGDLYVGEGWGLSYLPVKNGKVRWFSSLKLRTADKEVAIKDAVSAVKTLTKSGVNIEKN